MNSTAEDSASTYEPVEPGRRIEAVDMVRGFALFGVMLVNMFNFGAYSLIWAVTPVAQPDSRSRIDRQRPSGARSRAAGA